MILDGDVVWGSGHRLNKLMPVIDSLDVVIRSRLLSKTPNWVICGMAGGYDLRLAKIAIELGIPLVAAIPFREHVSNKEDYQFVLSKAALVHYVSEPGYAVWKYQTRNQWMVNNGTRGLVCWNGSKGGTRNCIQYAKGIGKPYDNIWKECLS